MFICACVYSVCLFFYTLTLTVDPLIDLGLHVGHALCEVNKETNGSHGNTNTAMFQTVI